MSELYDEYYEFSQTFSANKTKTGSGEITFEEFRRVKMGFKVVKKVFVSCGVARLITLDKRILNDYK